MRTTSLLFAFVRLFFDDMGNSHKNTETTHTPTAAELVQGVIGLISLPEVCIRINEMVDDKRFSAKKIGQLIGQDAALTVRLLRVVNSSLYQFPAKIETVSRAIAIIGHVELKELVLAATMSSIFERISSDLFDIDQFWRHGIYTGIIANNIANRCRVLHSERMFTAGLLHDIGHLVMSYKLPDQVRETYSLAAEQGLSIEEAEMMILGYNHAEVGAELMQQWGLPESHQMTTRFHNDPLVSKTYVLESMIIYLADQLAHLAESGELEQSMLDHIPKKVWAMTNMTEKEVETVLGTAREQFIEALQLFRPHQDEPHAA